MGVGRMPELIQVGCLLMTREQFERALREEMTISQAYEMIQRENLSTVSLDAEKEEAS